MPSPITIADSCGTNRPGRNLLVALSVFASFFSFAALAAPVPGVNEPHYLCKALHYWHPDWCAGDFFLESKNAHTVFYLTVGSLTNWLPLDQAAWCGRLLATAILAWGWCHLLGRFHSCRWFPLQACWLFLLLASCGNFSGEWLVGGVEGKVFSYGFLFGALGEFQRFHTLRASVLAGLAVAFHPVIGVWGLMAFVGDLCIQRIWNWRREVPRSVSSAEPSLKTGLAVVALGISALPGLLPVFLLLTESAPARTRSEAVYIQVYYRLAHHLDPMVFPSRSYLGYTALILLWLVLIRGCCSSMPHRQFNRIVAWSILFAIAGIIIGWGPRPASQMPWYTLRAQLLKFYPFRLADVLTPIAASMAIVGWLQSRRGLLWSVCAIALIASLAKGPSNVEVNRYSGELRKDWIDACQWIDDNLPRNALIQTPHNGWAFKWFAHRPEFVSFKDCPQDAAGIVEWNRRLQFLTKWFQSHYADEFYSAEELRDLRSRTGISHIFTDRLGPLELEPVFANDSFQIYDLTSLD